MNKLEKAIHELGTMDESAAGDSPLHRVHATAKLLGTIAYIATVMSFHKYALSGLLPMLLWPLVLFQMAGIRVRTCFYRLRIVLPLVLAVGLFNPFFDRHVVLRIGGIAVTGGVISMLTLALKGALCLMASFLLVATTPFDSICASLRRLHVPTTLVTLLLLTYRYIGVFMEETAIMTEAYHLRAPGQKGIHISAWGSFLGQQLLRSMDRAQELYAGMLLRGYRHEFPYAPAKPFAAKDAVFLFVSCAVFVFLRSVNAARLIGQLFVR